MPLNPVQSLKGEEGEGCLCKPAQYFGVEHDDSPFNANVICHLKKGFQAGIVRILGSVSLETAVSMDTQCAGSRAHNLFSSSTHVHI